MKPLVAGLLIAASVPPWGFWPCSFIGIAILDISIANKNARKRFVLGFLVGLAWLLPSTFWMIDLTPPGWIAASLIHSSFLAIGIALVPPRKGRQLALVGIMTLVELARWRFPFGGVPLASIPIGQASGPIAPLSKVAGPLLIVTAVTSAGCLMSTIIKTPKKAVKVLTKALIITVGLGTLTAFAPNGHEVENINIAVVQGGGPQRTRATPTGAAIVFANQVSATNNVETPVDLVVWPENVVNPDPDLPEAEKNPSRLYSDDARSTLKNLSKSLDTVISAGWFHKDPEDTTSNLNYVEVLEPEGQISGRFEKVRTVPFGEFVPLRGLVERFAKDSLPARDVRPGTEPAVINSSLGKLGVVISWEVFFEERAREAAKHEAGIIINPTNGASYWLTQVQSQQVASSQLRAIETGRWLLQSAPTGFSAIIDPSGKVIQRTGISEQAVLQAGVGIRTGNTWYTEIGIWPMLVISFMLFGLGRRPHFFGR
ncbi:MAG: apolipoprotein N-acyltransferase [Acidimicrobiales bacterium]|nr:apolipoprotein N-acyltransferase [Acidimicrobiales bacterium]MDP6894514.1 apolipoprotein N-acyltransferase [Acidimicrobiales bacterium]HJM37856.1 apolipoprotein N-acyltransferase [Acidimicrobiales bacterium]